MADVQCEWLILCEHPYIDEHGNQCLAGIFERVRPAAGDQQAYLPKLNAVAHVRGEPGRTFMATLYFHGPDGGQLTAMPTASHTLHAEWGTGTLVWTLTEWHVDVGTHEFRLHVNDQEVGRTLLDVYPPKLL